MSQVVLHLGEKYIQEDLEYYFSGERDKNNQVRPDENIYSMTPDSHHLQMDFSDKQVGNFFYPALPQALDKIYIGISVSLFANHWGASFLLELMKHVKPGGAIIIPVYPEGQAAEKYYWSRSFLENIFLSRERWTGFSNITAENDGVMSLRVGRKWPKPMPSSAEWFFKERANLLLAHIGANGAGQDIVSAMQTQFVPIADLAWQEYQLSALMEKIIIDFHGKDKKVTMQHIGQDYGMLVNDLILSPFIQLQQGQSWHVGDVSESIKNSIDQYFMPHTSASHDTYYGSIDQVQLNAASIMCVSHMQAEHEPAQYQALLTQLWDKCESQGILVVKEQCENVQCSQQLDAMLATFGEVHHYSSIAATPIQDKVEISQYSLAVEENLRQEKSNKQDVYRVIQKNA
jgi:hypothetical protein